MKKTIIVSAFPGTGKSYLGSNGSSNIRIMDLDSSSFSKLESGKSNPKFPQNYVDAIKELKKNGRYDLVFVSSHENVRKSLESNGIKYRLVYPAKALKYQYILRYLLRGDSDDFIDLMQNNWDTFIDSCSMDNAAERSFVLSHVDSYIYNIINDIIED